MEIEKGLTTLAVGAVSDREGVRVAGINVEGSASVIPDGLWLTHPWLESSARSRRLTPHIFPQKKNQQSDFIPIRLNRAQAFLW
jgi:hypothetical protein